MVERIILHAGTPKTGTTSLQIALNEHRDSLAARGLLYPQAMAASYAGNRNYSVKPKHQWLVDDLMAADGGRFAENVSKALGQASSNIDTVVLSTEGVFNHWWDFTLAGRQALAKLARDYRVEIWVWFRHPLEFFTSFYIQMLRNPRSLIPCHGQDWSPEQMLDDPWFAKHLDYAEFIDQARETVGRDCVRAFAHRKTVVFDFLSAMGISDLEVPELEENRTFGHVGVEVMRLINRCNVEPNRRNAVIDLVAQLDAEVNGASRAFELAPETRDRVSVLSAASLRRLKSEFGVELTT